MTTFNDLCIGDMFNTKDARWVKVEAGIAMCVMSALLPRGCFRAMDRDEDVIVLYSSIVET